MKKITILITIIFALSVFAITPTNQNVLANDGYLYDVDFAHNNEAFTLLSDLAIIDGEQTQDAPITRADFSVMLSKAINLGLVTSGYSLPYMDVNAQDSFYGSVYSLYAWGIISESDYFDPQRPISYNEAVKMVVCASGFEFIAKQNGGYPSGYLYAANQNKLLKGIDSDDFTYATSVELIYNMLMCTPPQIEYFDSNIDYKLNGTSTFLETVWHLKRASGVIDAGQYFGISHRGGVGYKKTSIGNIILKSGKFDTDSAFGLWAEAYYDEDYVIQSLYVRSDADNCVVIESDCIEDVSGRTYTYSVDDTKTKEATFATDALIIINQREASYDIKALKPQYGSVKLIRLNGSSAYNVVIIESYNELVVGAIDAEDEYVADINDPTTEFDFDSEEGNLDIYNQDGIRLDFGEIKVKDVLWTFKTADGELGKIIVCTDKIVGELNGIGDGVVQIDGQDYIITAKAKNSIDNSIPLGTIVECNINLNGQIVNIKSIADTTEYNIGYLIRTSVNGSGFEKTIQCKLLEKDGAVKTYRFAKQFMLNGDVCKKSAEENFLRMPQSSEIKGSAKCGIVTYKLNNLNEITELNYSDKSVASDASFINLYQNAHVLKMDGEQLDSYIEYKAMFNMLFSKSGRVCLASPTTVFMVPEEKDIAIAEDSHFSVKKLGTNGSYSTGASFSGYDHRGYTMTKDRLISEYMVSTFELKSSSNTVPVTNNIVIVAGMSRSMNEDGIPVDKITVRSTASGSGSGVYSEEQGYFTNLGIREGMFIKVNYNVDRIANAITPICDYDETAKKYKLIDNKAGYTLEKNGAMLNSNPGMATLASSVIMLGKVYNRDGNFINVCLDGVDPSNATSSDIYTLSLQSSSIIKYHTKSGTISTLTAAELRDYKHFGDSCDTILIETYSGNTKFVAVLDDGE